MAQRVVCPALTGCRCRVSCGEEEMAEKQTGVLIADNRQVRERGKREQTDRPNQGTRHANQSLKITKTCSHTHNRQWSRKRGCDKMFGTCYFFYYNGCLWLSTFHRNSHSMIHFWIIHLNVVSFKLTVGEHFCIVQLTSPPHQPICTLCDWLF